MVRNVIPLRLNCPGVMILTAFKWTVPRLVGLLVILAVFQAASALDDVCTQPKMVGPCRAAILRFYFNQESGSCESFVYGGCGRNDNNFATEAECNEKCSGGPCTQPKKVGRCSLLRSITRFYFNRESGSCEKFDYGDCDANGNNFRTEAECKEMCIDPCSKPKKVGHCRASIPRFYFDRNTGSCESFVYGGCGGNGNNFRTEAECKEMCIGPCYKPKKVGPCRASIPRFYFNRASGSCESFVYGGCDANGNNFRTEAECKETCVVDDPCSQPKKVGPCRASILRFYFDRESASCVSFVYGGCDANDNNFQTEVECNAKCSTDPCTQPKKVGPCRASIPSFYFDRESASCVSFVYGGCGANRNIFHTEAKCKEMCSSDRCSQPKKRGHCRASIPSFYFNRESGICELFAYGGCDANGNNFRTEAGCNEMCSGGRCSEPKKVGPCRAAITRFYFNRESGICDSFVYGGCDANGNNFRTEAECKEVCSGGNK